MSKTVKMVLGIVVVVVVVGGAGLYWFVLRDTSEKTASLDAIGTPSTTASGPAKTSADGAWKVKQDTGVFAGYRVQELFGGQTIKKTANGRSVDVSGTMTVSGASIPAAEIKVNTTKLTSDESRRDAAISTRGLETQKFPEATFKLTSPIALPSAPVANQEMSVTAKGDLTLHGTTKAVEVPLKATWDGNTIKVATVGEGLPITMADYGISPIEIPGFVKTDDKGTLELQLLFVPA
jgi:polyisoprenoid-binding protein YceI